eukprot:UN06090
MYQNEEYHFTSDSDENPALSSFSKPSAGHYNVHTVTPQIHSFGGHGTGDLSDLDIQHIHPVSVRKNTFSFRVGGKSKSLSNRTNPDKMVRTKSLSNPDQVGTDSEDITDEEKNQTENIHESNNNNGGQDANERIKRESFASITAPDMDQDNGCVEDYIEIVAFTDVNVDGGDAKPCLRLSTSLNIAKIDENKEVDQI